MVKNRTERIASDLAAVIAEKVFGWKDVHKYGGVLVGKKQDKAGRWRKARVPGYATDPLHAYAIEERMKKLGRFERYEKELARIAKAQDLPIDWTTPEHKSRAAIKSVAK